MEHLIYIETEEKYGSAWREREPYWRIYEIGNKVYGLYLAENIF